MSVAELREKLHQYIENADEQHLSAIYTLVGDSNSPSQNDDYELDDETINMLNERIEEYEKGNVKTYTLEESMERIRQLKEKHGL